jgi:hypothetical protein
MPTLFATRALHYPTTRKNPKQLHELFSEPKKNKTIRHDNIIFQFSQIAKGITGFFKIYSAISKTSNFSRSGRMPKH